MAVVQILDTANGASQLVYQGHTGSWTNGVAWSPAGDLVASAGYDDYSVRVWHAGSGETIAEAVVAGYEKDTSSVAWAPDGIRIAVGWKRGLTIYRARTGDLLTEVEDDQPAWGIAWSSDGALFGAMLNGGLCLYDATTYASVYEYEGSSLTASGQETTFAWSPDGKRIATTDVHGNIHVWIPPS